MRLGKLLSRIGVRGSVEKTGLRRAKEGRPRPERQRRATFETLEGRLLLSADPTLVGAGYALDAALPSSSLTQPVDAAENAAPVIVDAIPGSFLLTPVPEDAPVAMHIHVHLSIVIDGKAQVIPADIGVAEDGDLPIHTHDGSGLLHIESPVAQEFHLQDFFTVWGQTFTSQEILGHQVDVSHSLTMTVNGQVSTAFGSQVLHDQDDIVIQYGSSQTTAATASVWTDFLDYAPGTTALIGGSGFAPNETVDLQVVHIDGTPDTDASHTPWTVVADSNGAFSTSWLVDTVDALGSTLQVSAVGETSRAMAQTTFTDSVPHPFWIFAHNPNSIDDANFYVALGANALEPDIEYVGGELVVRHDTGLTSSSHDLIPYLQNLSSLANNSNLTLVAFDVKSEAANHPGAALELANDIQTYVLNDSPQLRIILSVASTADANAFFPALAGTSFVDNPAFAFQIDGEDDPLGEVNHLHNLLGPNAQIGFGDGTLGCCAQIGGVGPFIGPNTPPALQQAVWARTAFGTLNMASYAFAVTGGDSMKMLIDSGIDGLIPLDLAGRLAPIDTVEALSLVLQHYGGTYLATSADDPFSVAGSNGSRLGYALEVHTHDGGGAGTDSHITFTLHGELGDASAVVDSYWSKEMESGDTNYVFIPSGDLGRLKSITVSHDDAGNGPDWDLDWIKVRSAAYIGVGVYPTPGDPTKSLFEYYADFGGQTIEDGASKAVTIGLQSGIPLLATLTNGDLLLNMGPNAAARMNGNTADGDESFTVRHVSTQADGSETVIVSAFGLPPQTYKGVRQIHASGGAGSDTLTVDGAFTIPIFYDGGGNAGDTLVLQNASFDTITHRFTNAHDGSVALDPDGPGVMPATLIAYTGLAPITDNMGASNRIFDFTGAGETITLSDDAGAFAGVSRIDSTLGETVDFTNPTSTLTVNASAGTGPDTVNIQGLDGAFNANVTVDASDGGDQINVEATTGTTNTWAISGGSGDDVVRVDFGSLASPINVQGNGGHDSLLVNGTAGDDTIAISASAVGRGSEAVTYASIEDLTVDAMDGADVVTVNGTGPATTVLGGNGEDQFTVNATGPVGISLDGQDGSDNYIVNFGVLLGVVNVADTAADNAFDQLLVKGTTTSDTLLISPAFVKRNGTETVTYSGIEELDLDAGDGDDDITVDGTSVPTNVFGGMGDDDFTVNGSMAAPLHLDGGPGFDSLLFNGTSGDDVIILTDSSISGLGAGVTFVSIENFVVDAGAGNDIVDGSALTVSVTIYGGSGDDTLIGGSNDDKLYGQDGDDNLIGNLGNDYLDGGDGSDALVGDKGTIVREIVTGPASLLSIPSAKLQAVINEPGTNRANVTLIDADQGGDDVLVGGDGDDYLHGGAGNDKLAGNDGADALFGDAGNDELAGGAGDDHLYGGAGNDLLDGNAGADIAYGGDGEDRLIADQSGDRLIDWLGNFNTFEVPGPGYGGPTIVRSPSPWVQDFLLNLGRADGATNPNDEIRIVIPGSALQQSNSGPGGRA